MSSNLQFLILNTDYPEFLRWLYTHHPGLEQKPYKDQMQVRNESLFGVADFYSSNLRKLGHEAWDIHINNEFMQKAWAREHGLGVESVSKLSLQFKNIFWQGVSIAAKTPLRYLRPIACSVLHSLSLDNRQTWFYDLLAAQIKHFKPDILINQAMDGISSKFLQEMKPYIHLLIGQVASPLPKDEDFSCYDLVISSLPNFVNYFRKFGIPSELSRLGFEPRVLENLKENNRVAIPVSFVGNLFEAHGTRSRWLEYICQRFDVGVWGIGINNLRQGSPIRRCHMGLAWGIQMYQILHKSKITLNNHIDIAGLYANNCRLYEATGVGTMLITDWKENLHEMFEPGKEVVAYRGPEECADLIGYYLEHDDEREAIARAGQKRTLREHTYYERMQELLDIVQRHL